MLDEQTVVEKIEALREKLNEKMVNSENRMPDSETLKLSKRMDELLNYLTDIRSK